MSRWASALDLAWSGPRPKLATTESVQGCSMLEWSDDGDVTTDHSETEMVGTITKRAGWIGFPSCLSANCAQYSPGAAPLCPPCALYR